MIRKKLREKDGASIFMGLIFLLVCMMVGSVALTASTAASGKLAKQRENEQNYLTVASAARLLRDRIGALRYKQVTVDGSAGPGTLAASDGPIILKAELINGCKIFSDPTLTPTEKNFQIELDPASGPAAAAPDWKTVYGSLKVESDGKLLVKLWLGNAGGTDSHNRMNLEFCPDGGTFARHTDITYTESLAADGVTVEYTEIITVTTTCSWPEGGCTITKG